MTKVTYAIGDIHGRADEFQELIALIQEDMKTYPETTQFRVIQLGDIIDRGPDSRGAIELCMALPNSFPQAETHVLMGNHEQAILNVHRGDADFVAIWYPLEYGKGGGVTVLPSYGCDQTFNVEEPESIVAAIQKHLPQTHVDYLSALPAYLEDDQYLFVHSGILPGIPLSEQSEDKMIALYGDEREAFMQSTLDHGKIIVHGHTPHPNGEVLPNRVNTDAGAAYNMHLQCAVLPEKYDIAEVRTLTVEVAGEAKEWLSNEEYTKRYGKH